MTEDRRPGVSCARPAESVPKDTAAVPGHGGEGVMSTGLNRVGVEAAAGTAAPVTASWRGIAWTNRAAQVLGGGALVLMMGVTVADVVLRNLFSMVVPGSMEINGLLMIVVALSTLGAVELARGHINVDMLLQV